MIKNTIKDCVEIPIEEGRKRWINTVLNSAKEEFTLGVAIGDIDTTKTKNGITQTELNQNNPTIKRSHNRTTRQNKTI